MTFTLKPAPIFPLPVMYRMIRVLAIEMAPAQFSEEFTALNILNLYLQREYGLDMQISQDERGKPQFSGDAYKLYKDAAENDNIPHSSAAGVAGRVSTFKFEDLLTLEKELKEMRDWMVDNGFILITESRMYRASVALFEHSHLKIGK
ncbi:hypothetical protein [Nissabacter sp. SGAir0207]|uniref:hypothetical protein n=1 Tax=Nissabacter sp. SGAir0207 TaxID=2126321 RepID=UPI0010CCBC86|nr:hypothetical protein [Nissabacter sp. SGAir0207]QCR38898.1 hypothetical protein C1N62_22560 [Nissabacter sp. SGAir0207]